jgi:hypothetical protein
VQPPAEPPPIVLMQEGSGEVTFSPPTATLAGSVELDVVGAEEVLTHWTDDDRAQWHFRLVNPGAFQAELTYALTAEEGEALLVVDEQPRPITLRSTGSLEQFHSDAVTLVIPNGGEHTLEFRPGKRAEGAGLVLKTVRLIPVAVEKTPAVSPP